MEDLLNYLLLVGVGLLAGFINVVAGGGSLLTLPTMIFLGLPTNVANASNRIAVIVQNIFAIKGFHEEKISTYPYNLYLSATALIGALIGAQISVDMDEALFKKALSIVMIIIIAYTIFKPKKKGEEGEENLSTPAKIKGMIIFFFIGIYGGFIQAGVGLLVMSALSIVNSFSLVKANSAKVVIICLFNIASLALFLYHGLVDWKYGLILAIGNATGGYLASKWQVKSGEKWIKRFLIVAVLGLAIKLWL